MEMATNAIMGAPTARRGTLYGALVVLAVGDETADDLCARLETQIAALRVGPGLDQTPENEMGRLSPPRTAARCWATLTAGKPGGESARGRPRL